jgi:hypothetical protein
MQQLERNAWTATTPQLVLQSKFANVSSARVDIE